MSISSVCTYALFVCLGGQKSLSFALKDFVLIIFLKYIFEIFCNETLLINTPLTIKADLNTIKIHFPNPNTYNFFFSLLFYHTEPAVWWQRQVGIKEIIQEATLCWKRWGGRWWGGWCTPVWKVRWSLMTKCW